MKKKNIHKKDLKNKDKISEIYENFSQNSVKAQKV